jgi:hypothetical protein
MSAKAKFDLSILRQKGVLSKEKYLNNCECTRGSEK